MSQISSFLDSIIDLPSQIDPEKLAISSIFTSPIDPIKVYSNKILSNITKQKLLSFQEKHVLKLLTIILTHNIALDSSDTGIGKTYTSAALCRELERKAIVLCPKTLIFNWMSVLQFMGVKYYDIVNYETIKAGKSYTNSKCNKRKKSSIVEILDYDPNDPTKFLYNWKIPSDAIVIFDEVHKCKDPKTSNGKLLLSAKQLVQNKIPIVMLSATISEKIRDMQIPFYLFGIISNTKNFGRYMKRMKKYYDGKTEGNIIHNNIEKFTSRIRIKDLGDKFPKNQWCAQPFIASDADEIATMYQKIAEYMEKIKQRPDTNHLVQIQKLKQEIELRKIPIFIEQTRLYLDEKKSVIIFVNYLDTLHILSETLGIKCQIHGRQTLDERKDAIDRFQSNVERMIICQVRAGGVGIGLHDVDGNYPRVVLINYPDSASDLLQALGRAARNGTKSPVLQRIITVANVEYEKRIMENINMKLRNIVEINDGE